MTDREKKLTPLARFIASGIKTKNLLGDHSVMDPPDPMPNSEVKHNSADGSVGSPHVRVGHRQALNKNKIKHLK